MYQDIDAHELARRREANPELVLLDVRENDELAIASVPWARHVPMAQLPNRLDEFDRDAEIVVMCHHGGRSTRVAQFLVARGFAKVLNFDGGIDAYAEHLDPAVARY